MIYMLTPMQFLGLAIMLAVMMAVSAMGDD
jgi:hypothetical protein